MKANHLLITVTLLLIANCLFSTPASAQPLRFYGLAEGGGANSSGVIFEYNRGTTTYTNQFDFGTTNGTNPYGALMQASDYNLYGMTYSGGANGYGVLFQFNPVTSTYTKKIDFAGTTNGRYPRGSLMQATDENIYGMTEVGGANGGGVIFRFNLDSTACTDVFDFGAPAATGPVGHYPYGSLMQAADGSLYGMTSAGGPANDGDLFKFNPLTLAYTDLVDFAGTSNGASPTGALIQATDSNLYGLTYAGGAAGEGVLFQYNAATNTYSKKIEFGAIAGTGSTNGIYPSGSLVQASDGKLYGMTEQGGVNAVGVLFQFNPTNSAYTKELDFDLATSGANPYGSLMKASDGNLYGVTKGGGANGFGVLFKYIPSISGYTKLYDFTGTDGQYPWFTNLVELATPAGMNEVSAGNSISLSPNPATNQLTIQTSSHASDKDVAVIIMNVLGKVVQEEKLTWSNSTSLNIKNLPAGIYFLQMKTENERMTERFVKE